MRRWHLAILAVLSLLALACEGTDGAAPAPTSTSPSPRRPPTMAALGDSITAGYGSCAVYVACSRNSWSAGGSDDVDSHYRRIKARSAKAKARNLSVPGAESEDLRAQAANAVDARADYVTILIGANDACAPDTDAMTGVTTFRNRVDAALDRLKDGLPRARVLIVSIPDLYRLWELGHTSPAAVAAWDRGICPSMLARPTSTAAADERRRAAVRDRIEDYNTQLTRACRAYGKRCRTDGGAAHRVRFSLDLVNKVDYFHPNLAGQNTLADVTWPGRITW